MANCVDFNTVASTLHLFYLYRPTFRIALTKSQKKCHFLMSFKEVKYILHTQQIYNIFTNYLFVSKIWADNGDKEWFLQRSHFNQIYDSKLHRFRDKEDIQNLSNYLYPCWILQLSLNRCQSLIQDLACIHHRLKHSEYRSSFTLTRTGWAYLLWVAHQRLSISKYYKLHSPYKLFNTFAALSNPL